MSETKICNQCEEELPIESFSTKGRQGGRKGKCNSCRYKARKETDPDFREKENARKRSYRKERFANDPVYRANKSQENRDARQAYKVKHGRSMDYGTKHGMTYDERMAFLAQNDGMCVICNVNPSTDVDHDHACCPGKYGCSKCVRDPLCNPCNSMLGAVNDSKAILQAGILYLCKHNQDGYGI